MKPSKEREAIVKYEQRFKHARQGVSKKHDVWKMLDTFDRGEQWKDAAIPPWVPKPVTNFVRYVRTLKRANLASAIPKSTAIPLEEEYADLIQRLQKAYDHVWVTEKLPRLIRRSVDRAIIQGTSIAYVYDDDSHVGGTYYGQFNPKNKLYQGKICVKRIPNANFFPDPDATTIHEMKFCEVTQPISREQVMNTPVFMEYAGNKLNRLRSASIDKDESTAGTIYNRDNKVTLNESPVNGDEMLILHTHFERYFKGGKWRLDISYYIENHDFFLLRLENVKPNVYPFAVLHDEEEEGDFWGTSSVMDFIENQKIINKTAQTASIIGTLHQNPQKVVSKSSGINGQELARTGTMPGKVWTTNDDPRNSIVNVEPPKISREIFEVEDRMKQDIREMVGVNEAYTGQSVGSLTTSTGVNSLIERATIRDKDKMIQIDAFVEDLSNIIFQFILHKWTQKRPITTVNPDGTPSYDTFEPIDPEMIDNLDWIMRSDVYARAPQTQASKRQQADRLMQFQGQFNFPVPIITPEEWIQFQDFDMKEQILRRMQKDRIKMETEKAANLANIIGEVAQMAAQLQAQGTAPQTIQQEIQKLSQQLVEQLNADEQNRPRDGAQQSQAPQGATGQMAMNAMAQGM